MRCMHNAYDTIVNSTKACNYLIQIDCRPWNPPPPFFNFFIIIINMGVRSVCAHLD